MAPVSGGETMATAAALPKAMWAVATHTGWSEADQRALTLRRLIGHLEHARKGQQPK